MVVVVVVLVVVVGSTPQVSQLILQLALIHSGALSHQSSSAHLEHLSSESVQGVVGSGVLVVVLD